mgnify:CR=1 FL=1
MSQSEKKMEPKEDDEESDEEQAPGLLDLGKSRLEKEKAEDKKEEEDAQ